MIHERNNISDDEYMIYEYSNNLAKTDDKSQNHDNRSMSMLRNSKAFYKLSRQNRCSVILGFTILIFLVVLITLIAAFFLTEHFPCYKRKCSECLHLWIHSKETGKCYRFFKTFNSNFLTWSDAQQSCRNQGVSI